MGWAGREGWIKGWSSGSDFVGFVMTVETDRHMDLQRARDVGFADEIRNSDVVKRYAVAFGV